MRCYNLGAPTRGIARNPEMGAHHGIPAPWKLHVYESLDQLQTSSYLSSVPSIACYRHCLFPSCEMRFIR